MIDLNFGQSSRQAFSPRAFQLPFVRSAGRGDGAVFGAAAAGEWLAAGAGGEVTQVTCRSRFNTRVMVMTTGWGMTGGPGV